VGTELMWFRMGSSGGVLCRLLWIFGLYRTRIIYWLYKQLLASQKWLCSVYLVYNFSKLVCRTQELCVSLMQDFIFVIYADFHDNGEAGLGMLPTGTQRRFTSKYLTVPVLQTIECMSAYSNVLSVCELQMCDGSHVGRQGPQSTPLIYLLSCCNC
jgi:hypothetical protein